MAERSMLFFARDTSGPVVQVAIRDYGIRIDARHQRYSGFIGFDGGTARRTPVAFGFGNLPSR